MVWTEFFLALVVDVLMMSLQVAALLLLTVHLVDLLGVHAVEVVAAATFILGPAVEARQVAQVHRLENLTAVEIPLYVTLSVDCERHLDLRLRARLFPAGSLAHDAQAHKGLSWVRVTLRIVERLKQLLQLRSVFTDERTRHAVLVHLLPADGQYVGDLEAERIRALHANIKILSAAAQILVEVRRSSLLAR